jgi:hypothetical protein
MGKPFRPSHLCYLAESEAPLAEGEAPSSILILAIWKPTT